MTSSKKLVVLLAVFFSISGSAEINYKEKSLEYLNLGKAEYKVQNFDDACSFLNLSQEYAEMLGDKKLTSSIETLATDACKKKLMQSMQKLNDMVKNNPYNAQCKKVAVARRECSKSGNYDNCMRINFGPGYQNFDGAGACAFVN